MPRWNLPCPLRMIMVLAGAAALSACSVGARDHQLHGSRTVFDNPYVAPELDDRMVGPEAEDRIDNDDRWLDGLFYPGAGRYAYDRDGNRVRLSRRDRRELRQRGRLIAQTAEQNRRVADFNARTPAPPPPEPSAPPVAAPSGTPASDRPAREEVSANSPAATRSAQPSP